MRVAPPLIVSLALALGLGVPLLSLAHGGRSHPAPLESPAGLEIPPARVALREPSSPVAVATAPIEGAPSRPPPPPCSRASAGSAIGWRAPGAPPARPRGGRATG